MTLITYLARVHFADRVLEEALYSELELNRYSRPLLVFESDSKGTESHERLYSGVPARSDVKQFVIKHDRSAGEICDDLLEEFKNHDGDVLIAFGSARAIAIAGVCFQILTDQHARKRRKSKKWLSSGPGFFAVPGVDGLPGLSYLKTWTKNPTGFCVKKISQPSVIICDPSLTLGEEPEATASAAVNALSRCMEAYLAQAYNPPADGIALDGIARIVGNLHEVLEEDSLEKRRELMAAGLGGALAEQKGSGLAQALCDTLALSVETEIDEGALKRILLPSVLELEDGSVSVARKDQIRTAIGVPANLSMREGLQEFLLDLPLPNTLAELGISEPDISESAKKLTTDVEVSVPSEYALRTMMEALFEPA